MTREEIRTKARALAGNLAIWRERMGNEELAERELLSLVLSTLQEAARAACGRCARRMTLVNNAVEWVHFDFEDRDFPCNASEIHDLIAALDKEGDRE